MPTPDQTERGWSVTMHDGQVIIRVSLGHEIAARTGTFTPAEAIDLADEIKGLFWEGSR